MRLRCDMKIIGYKLYMKTIFDDQRNQVPVTVLDVKPNYVTQVKTEKSDGYTEIQIGFRETKEQHLNKPQLGHLKKSSVIPVAKLTEFRTKDADQFKAGDPLTVESFSRGELIDVSALSKGRGFAGVVKRYKFSGGPKTHGQSDRHRAPGSIGQSSNPSRVFKGKKMPGRMGHTRVTVKNLEIIDIDKDNHLLLVKGSVPGSRNTLVEVRKR